MKRSWLVSSIKKTIQFSAPAGYMCLYLVDIKSEIYSLRFMAQLKYKMVKRVVYPKTKSFILSLKNFKKKK